jgi:uncharacterized membrane protein YecN with MAPEG domain
MILLPITLTIAAAAALVNIWLAVRVGRVRIASKVSIGDGGVPVLASRMRAQANFVEYTPFFLILLGLVELAHGSATWLWLVAIAYILCRIAHAFGMDRPVPNPFRMAGFGGSVLLTLGLAGYALALTYGAPHAAARAPTMTVLGR